MYLSLIFMFPSNSSLLSLKGNQKLLKQNVNTEIYATCPEAGRPEKEVGEGNVCFNLKKVLLIFNIFYFKSL
jgi:hypothetical protein